MRLFLDSSMLLAACGSESGASREIFRRCRMNDWSLLASPYVVHEVEGNLPRMSASAFLQWQSFRLELQIMHDVFVLDLPAVFARAKDRPVLFSALVWADVLLTLDRSDFGEVMQAPFYGLLVMTPGAFLERERAALRLV